MFMQSVPSQVSLLSRASDSCPGAPATVRTAGSRPRPRNPAGGAWPHRANPQSVRILAVARVVH